MDITRVDTSRGPVWVAPRNTNRETMLTDISSVITCLTLMEQAMKLVEESDAID